VEGGNLAVSFYRIVLVRFKYQVKKRYLFYKKVIFIQLFLKKSYKTVAIERQIKNCS